MIEIKKVESPVAAVKSQDQTASKYIQKSIKKQQNYNNSFTKIPLSDKAFIKDQFALK